MSYCRGKEEAEAERRWWAAARCQHRWDAARRAHHWKGRMTVASLISMRSLESSRQRRRCEGAPSPSYGVHLPHTHLLHNKLILSTHHSFPCESKSLRVGDVNDAHSDPNPPQSPLVNCDTPANVRCSSGER
ncbi:hypothetical protein BHE74_00003997 [Ensete ventricosum]|nr:hypothetical protein GW17_00015248 [Ensete ventricosum]RWW87192.1 hypothetical protein BHE74_00003997 [Ensete ventricosum]RZR81707.1 hypothetical protein BHM03_00007999 [Ensete ventricosum]